MRARCRLVTPLIHRPACGTVDCCHEREGQLHSWKAPPGGTHHPVDRGARHPQLTTERAHRARPMAGSVCARTLPAGHPSDSQASLQQIQQMPSVRAVARRPHRRAAKPRRAHRLSRMQTRADPLKLLGVEPSAVRGLQRHLQLGAGGPRRGGAHHQDTPGGGLIMLGLAPEIVWRSACASRLVAHWRYQATPAAYAATGPGRTTASTPVAPTAPIR